FALAYAKACDADEEEALAQVEAAFAPGTAGVAALEPAGNAPSTPQRVAFPKQPGPLWRIWLALALGVGLCFWGLNVMVTRGKAPKAVAPEPAQVQGKSALGGGANL